jgi:hypothetical protein
MGEKPNEIMPQMYSWFLLQYRNGEDCPIIYDKTAFIKRQLHAPYFKQMVIHDIIYKPKDPTCVAGIDNSSYYVS